MFDSGLNVPGVYWFVCMPVNRRYIGSSINMRKRRKAHEDDLRNGTNSPFFQKAWDEYGAENFVFEVVEEVPLPAYQEKSGLSLRDFKKYVWRPILQSREQMYLDMWSDKYNICPIAYSRLGAKNVWTDEQHEAHRQKMLGNKSRTGQNWTPEEHADRAALFERLREERDGFIFRHSDEFKLRCATWMAGNTHFLGKTHSVETRDLLSIKRTGVALSPEHAEKARENITKANETNPANKPGWIPTHRIGTTHTAETKAKMSASQKGHTHNTPDVVEKMKAAHKAHWDARREAGTTGLKLSNEQIIEAFLSPLSGKALAEKWGIDRSTINKIRSRKLNPSVTEHLVSPERDGRGRAIIRP